MDRSTDCAIALRSTDKDPRPILVGTLAGEIISDEELRAHSSVLGRALVLLRRLDDIMVRTAEARGRRGALLAELAECFWNEQMSSCLRQDPVNGARREIGPPRALSLPAIEANDIWNVPE